MRSLFLVFLVNIMLAANILSCSEPIPVKSISYAGVDSRVPTEMTILFGGDYMQHAPQLSGAMNLDGSYDFAALYSSDFLHLGNHSRCVEFQKRKRSQDLLDFIRDRLDSLRGNDGALRLSRIKILTYGVIVIK
jgi:hypothetical protein